MASNSNENGWNGGALPSNGNGNESKNSASKSYDSTKKNHDLSKSSEFSSNSFNPNSSDSKVEVKWSLSKVKKWPESSDLSKSSENSKSVKILRVSFQLNMNWFDS